MSIEMRELGRPNNPILSEKPEKSRPSFFDRLSLKISHIWNGLKEKLNSEKRFNGARSQDGLELNDKQREIHNHLCSGKGLPGIKSKVEVVDNHKWGMREITFNVYKDKDSTDYLNYDRRQYVNYLRDIENRISISEQEMV
jgi:hypothetical protein